MIDSANLGQLKTAVKRLKKNVADEMEDTLQKNAKSSEETVVKNAEAMIEAKADVGALGDKPGQESLYDSFGSRVSKDVRKDGVSVKLTVGSNAPHAAALNEGTDQGDGYEIAPTNKPQLVFEGKPSDEYLVSSPGISSVYEGAGDSGGDIVTMKPGVPVTHPGVSETRYLETSLDIIEDEIGDELNNAIRRAILESGFKPSTK